jgi:hypothetical protein
MSKKFPLKIEAPAEALAKQWMFFFVFKRGGASLLHSLVHEAPKQLVSNPYPVRGTGCFAGVLQRSTFEAVNLGGDLTSKIEAPTEALAKQSGISVAVTDYAEELLRFASQYSQSKKDENQVSLPIPTGFDLPDRAKIYRTAYDLWQPVREKMPTWGKYMSLRKAHQNGDHTLAQAHKEAEQAYYAACQQCPAFQYYNQVRQKLFPAQKKSETDWYKPSHKEASL